MIDLNKKIQTIKDEQIVGDKKIEFVEDCRKYGLMTKRIKNYNLRISTEMTVKLLLENPLEEAWLIEGSDELQFDPTTMTIWNAVGINGETVPLVFKEMAGMVIGGLSGSGKSAGLFTSFVKMVKTGLVDVNKPADFPTRTTTRFTIPPLNTKGTVSPLISTAFQSSLLLGQTVTL